MALGKTNITALSEGAIVTEIEDYKWVQMQAGITGNFVKAIYKNDYLAAITADGTVAYTTDGEVWQTFTPEYEGCKFNDIYWDARRYIIVGSYEFTDTSSNKKYQRGLILTTSDFFVYEKAEISSEFSLSDNETGRWISEYLGIYMENSQYFALGIEKSRVRVSVPTNRVEEYTYLYRFAGNLVSEWEKLEIRGHILELNPLISVANNSNKFMISYSGTYSSGTYTYSINEICVITSCENKSIESNNNSNNRLTPVFECKNELYYMRLYTSDNYKLSKVIDSDEKITLSQDINYGFVDGIYFNNCIIFINAHEMLIVKNGESIADKTLDDLIEISPELTMNCITKAFGQLYLFGNQGAILKSSVETNNEETITVQALSAKKALAEAKIYTDEQVAALESKVAMLEERIGALETTPETE